jgi:hypothetical protein
MAIAWVLRHGGMTRALTGASKPEQVVACCRAIGNLDFTDAELAQISQVAGQKDINLWARSARLDCHRMNPLLGRHGPALHQPWLTKDRLAVRQSVRLK